MAQVKWDDILYVHRPGEISTKHRHAAGVTARGKECGTCSEFLRVACALAATLPHLR